MSMPPGPDPNSDSVKARNAEVTALRGESETRMQTLEALNSPVHFSENARKFLRERMEARSTGGALSNELLNDVMRPLARPLSEARRSGQVGKRLTFEGQRFLYAARIRAFDVWDHDGHHSSEIMTDLVDMWSLREAGEMRKGRRRRWEMLKLLWVALRQRSTNTSDRFTIEEISRLPYDSHRRVAANPRFSQVLMEMGISAVHENPDHLNSDWFGEPRYHWWSTDDPKSIGEQLETNVLMGFFELLTQSLGIAPKFDPTVLQCPFDGEFGWPDSLVITYDGSVLTDGFDNIALNWRGSNLTTTIEAPWVGQDPDLGLWMMRIVTPIPTRNDIIGPAPVF